MCLLVIVCHAWRVRLLLLGLGAGSLWAAVRGKDLQQARSEQASMGRTSKRQTVEVAKGSLADQPSAKLDQVFMIELRRGTRSIVQQELLVICQRYIHGFQVAILGPGVDRDCAGACPFLPFPLWLSFSSFLPRPDVEPPYSVPSPAGELY